MSSNVIVKSKGVVVEDDFFDEIVNGLQTPIEKETDKKSSKKSKNDLSNNQKSRIQKYIAPIIMSQVERNGIVQSYIQKVEQSHFVENIKKIQKECRSVLGKYLKLSQQTDDETEDVDNDKPNYLLFLYKGYKLYKTISKLYRFYEVIKKSVEIYKKTKNNYTFNIKDYDLKDENDVKRAKDDLKKYLHGTMNKFVPALHPFIEYTTIALWETGMGAYDFINDKIWNYLKKEALELAVEVGITALIAIILGSVSGGAGTAAVAAVVQGTTLGRRVKKFFDVVNLSKKIADATKGIKYIKTLRNTKPMRKLRKVGEWADRYAADAIGDLRDTYKFSKTVYHVIDIFHVTEEELEELKGKVREKTEPHKNKLLKKVDALGEYVDVFAEFKNNKKNINEKFVKKIESLNNISDADSFWRYSKKGEFKYTEDDYSTEIVFKNFYVGQEKIDKTIRIINDFWYKRQFDIIIDYDKLHKTLEDKTKKHFPNVEDKTKVKNDTSQASVNYTNVLRSYKRSGIFLDKNFNGTGMQADIRADGSISSIVFKFVFLNNGKEVYPKKQNCLLNDKQKNQRIVHPDRNFVTFVNQDNSDFVAGVGLNLDLDSCYHDNIIKHGDYLHRLQELNKKNNNLHETEKNFLKEIEKLDETVDELLKRTKRR